VVSKAHVLRCDVVNETGRHALGTLSVRASRSGRRAPAVPAAQLAAASCRRITRERKEERAREGTRGRGGDSRARGRARRGLQGMEVRTQGRVERGRGKSRSWAVAALSPATARASTSGAASRETVYARSAARTWPTLRYPRHGGLPVTEP
jgi:hypothetical protein